MKRAIFGGSFNPPHSEHVKIVKKLASLADVSEVIVIPTFCPPHKESDVDYETRMQMARIAFGNIEKVIVSDIEKKIGGKSYTAKTLPVLHEKYGDFYYVIGGDSLLNILNWYEPEKVLSATDLYVFARGDEKNDKLYAQRDRILKMGYGKQVVIDDIPLDRLSSSSIRKTVTLSYAPDAPQQIDEYLNEVLGQKLYDFIKGKKLYSNEYAEMIEKLHSTIPLNTYRHSLLTTMLGLQLNEQLNLDVDKVFTGCLLHDCAKNKLDKMDGVPVSAYKIMPIVHQYTGAIIAEKEFGIKDKQILQAIKYHTTSHKAATELDKLVYMADSLAYGRKYDGLEPLRALALSDFRGGYAETVKRNYEFTLKSGNPVYYLTKIVYNELTNK